MDILIEFVTNLFRGFVALGLIAVGLGIIALLISFVLDYRNIREERSNLSTGVGNALLTLHSFFEPGVKPQTEQVIWIKKRRTPIEKMVPNLSEFTCEDICIKGYKVLKNKKYKRKL